MKIVRIALLGEIYLSLPYLDLASCVARLKSNATMLPANAASTNLRRTFEEYDRNRYRNMDGNLRGFALTAWLATPTTSELTAIFYQFDELQLNTFKTSKEDAHEQNHIVNPPLKSFSSRYRY